MKATKLPSGRYRARAYDFRDATGKVHTKSFTAKTKKEAELLATKYELSRESARTDENITVGQAIDRYIEQNKGILSETTIESYQVYRNFGFQDLMDVPVHKLSNLMLRDAVSKECQRITRRGTQIKAKTVRGEFALLSASCRLYNKNIDFDVPLPRIEKNLVNLPTPEAVFDAVKGSDIELCVLLSMWLSFSFSEIKGLKRSSIHGDYIQIDQVRVRVGKELVEKKLAKVDTRTRKHRIPPYIKSLIDKLPSDQEYLVDLSYSSVRRKFDTLLKAKGIEHISIHKCRHINASTMALLQIPDVYAQQRGGWSTDSTMKRVYTHTFSQARIEVDDKIDEYFNGIVGQKSKQKKLSYKKFLEVLNLEKSDDTKQLYEDYKKL